MNKKNYLLSLIYFFIGGSLLGVGLEKIIWFANKPLLTKNLGDAVLNSGAMINIIGFFGVGFLLISLGYITSKKL